MKIKNITLLLVLPLLVGCGSNGQTTSSSAHVHTFDMEHWESNETMHWHKATCGCNDITANLGPHEFGGDDTCDICRYTKPGPGYYVVSFNTHCEIIVDPQQVSEGGFATRPENPERIDYYFMGWYDNPEYSGEPYVFGTRVTQDLTLHALWGGKVTFYNYDLTIIDEEVTRVNSKVSEPINEPSYSNAHFAGWYLNHQYDGEPFDFDTLITKNTNLYAGYSHKVTYIDFDKRVIGVEDILLDESLNKPADPIRDYHDFENWYEDETYLIPYEFGHKLNEDISVYANFTPKTYQIVYHNVNGITHDNPASYVYGVGVDSFSNEVTLDNPNEKFYGWYFDEELTSEATSISKTTHGVVDIYAKRADMYDINYVNWPSGVINPNKTKYTKYDVVYFDKTPIEETGGYLNISFNIDNVPVTSIPLGTTGNIEVTLKYNFHSTSIRLDLNGGTVDGEGHDLLVNVYYSQSYELPEPIRDEHTFIGWQNSDYEIVPSSGIWTLIDDSLEYVALWDLINKEPYLSQISAYETSFKSQLNAIDYLRDSEEIHYANSIHNFCEATRLHFSEYIDKTRADALLNSANEYLTGLIAEANARSLANCRETYLNGISSIADNYISLLGPDTEKIARIEQVRDQTIEKINMASNITDIENEFEFGKQLMNDIFYE